LLIVLTHFSSQFYQFSTQTKIDISLTKLKQPILQNDFPGKQIIVSEVFGHKFPVSEFISVRENYVEVLTPNVSNKVDIRCPLCT